MAHAHQEVGLHRHLRTVHLMDVFDGPQQAGVLPDELRLCLDRQRGEGTPRFTGGGHIPGLRVSTRDGWGGGWVGASEADLEVLQEGGGAGDPLLWLGIR